MSYALYKQAIRETALHGRPSRTLGLRDPAPTEVAVYRGMAATRLNAFGDVVIEEATPDIIHTTLYLELRRVEANLARHIDRATGWRPAVITNLAAWLLSIAITFLIAIAGIPGWILALITKMKTG